MNGAGKTSVITLLIAAQLSPTALSPIAAGAQRASRCPEATVRIGPDKSIQAVIDRNRPGTRFCIKRGVYRLQRPIRPRRGDVLVFEKGAVLNGAKVITRWERDGDVWKAGGQTQSFQDPRPKPTPCEPNPAACEFEDLFMDGRPLRRVLTKSELAPGRFFFDETVDTIFIRDNPSARLLEATVATTAIEARGVDDVTVRGATIRHFAHHGIATSKGWTLKGVDIAFVHSTGIKLFGNGIVRRSRIHRCGNMGLSIDGNNVRIVGNRIARNNYLRFGRNQGPWQAGAAKVLKSRRIILRSNHIHDNVGDGWWFDTDNIDVTVQGNVFENNDRYGLAYEASFRATISGNTFRRNGSRAWGGAGLWINSSRDLDVYGNRFSKNSQHAIAMTSNDRGRSDYGVRRTANVRIRRNLIRIADGFAVKVFGNQDIYSSRNRFRTNRYLVPNLAGEWWYWKQAPRRWRRWKSFGHDLSGTLSEP